MSILAGGILLGGEGGQTQVQTPNILRGSLITSVSLSGAFARRTAVSPWVLNGTPNGIVLSVRGSQVDGTVSFPPELRSPTQSGWLVEVYKDGVSVASVVLPYRFRMVSSVMAILENADGDTGKLLLNIGEQSVYLSFNAAITLEDSDGYEARIYIAEN